MTKQIKLANPRGFCAGVDRAIDIVNKALDIYGAPVYVKHEVVHNKVVVADLRDRGAIFVEEIDEIHQFIKSFLFEKTSLKSKVQVLYGGSVNPENARQIKSLITVDGVLVGGASLSAEKFKQICM